jgi:cytidylate kinase
LIFRSAGVIVVRVYPNPNASRAALRDRLRHVYWIGGGSGAGKSTVAGRLADRYGLRRYSTDDAMPDHARRTTPVDAPFLAEFLAMSMDQRWVDRTPETMLDTFHWYRGEGFGLIVEDLLRLPPQPRVVVEGFRLLPHLVRPLLAVPDHAVWLLPTPEFRQAALVSRGDVWSFTERTSDPERARRNIAERDRMFTERLGHETVRLGLRRIDVGPAMTEEELVDRVAGEFGLRSAGGAVGGSAGGAGSG